MVITGAGRGIGAATALLAGRKGYIVCVNYLRNEQAAKEQSSFTLHTQACVLIRKK